MAIDNSHSDSVSDSSPVFAHSPNESDLDGESFGLRGGAASVMSGMSGRPGKDIGMVGLPRHGGRKQRVKVELNIW